jgi:hypothetical protein
MEEVTGSEEQENLYNTADETRPRKQPRLQKCKNDECTEYDNSLDDPLSSSRIPLRPSATNNPSLSAPPSKCPQ